MKATVIALLICLSFIAADASILGQILNQTKLQGRYNLNTSNGVDLDYNANLVYDNGYVKLDLLNFGGRFNATPEAQNNSADHGAVYKYAGRVHVNQGGHHANASVLGVAGGKVDVEIAMNSTTNSVNVTYNQTLFNKNVWAVQADETLAHGAGGAVVHAGGHVQQEGDHVKVHHAAHVNGTVVGGIRHNGTHLGNFTLARASQVVVNQTARTHGFGIPEHHNHTHHNHTHGNHSHHHNHTRPNITFGGKALFHDQVVVGWNGQTVGEEKLGEALFGGASWIHHAQDDNGTTNGVATAQKALYRYRNRVEQNGQRVAGGHVRGHVGSIHTAGARQWQNGTTDVILGHVGRLSHNAAVRPDGNQTHHNDSISSFEVEALEDGEDFIKGHHGHNGTILAHVGAAWKGGALIRAEPNANGTQVRVHGGSAGRAWGIDSVHRHPWHVAGNRTVNAAFQVAQNVSEINNIDVDVERDSKILNTLNAFERQAQGNKYFRGL